MTTKITSEEWRSSIVPETETSPEPPKSRQQELIKACNSFASIFRVLTWISLIGGIICLLAGRSNGGDMDSFISSVDFTTMGVQAIINSFLLAAARIAMQALELLLEKTASSKNPTL